jgi:hypothetical protein
VDEVLADGARRAHAIAVETIKEVKAYVLKGNMQVASIVTNSGIEGNYTLGSRYWHPDWNNQGWLEYAKQVLIGKSALDRAALTSSWDPPKRRRGQRSTIAG